MTRPLRIAAAQTEEYREDLRGALKCAADVANVAQREGVSLLCFPECFLQGYLTSEAEARRNALDLESPEFRLLLSRFSENWPTIVLGLIEERDGLLFNTAAVIRRRALRGRYRKAHLLTGERFFTPGNDTPIFEISGLKFGINICYDTNFPEAAQKVSELGASFIVCPANNMLARTKAEKYKDVHNAVRSDRCRETGLWLISADVTGERDGRISWGPTAVLNPRGEVVAQLPLEKPGLLLYDIQL